MTIATTSQTETDGVHYFEMECGKKAAFISFNPALGLVNVLCKNASHAAYRGMGRMFWSGWAEAKTGYKSAEMLAMIAEAEYLTYCATH